jgi:uncharacterized protein with HEPN domain
MIAHSARVWLIDIREEIAGTQDLTKEAGAFSANWGMKRAVEHALLIIAEAAKYLPQSPISPARFRSPQPPAPEGGVSGRRGQPTRRS